MRIFFIWQAPFSSVRRSGLLVMGTGYIKKPTPHIWGYGNAKNQGFTPKDAAQCYAMLRNAPHWYALPIDWKVPPHIWVLHIC
jgi:hypothetical protein